MFASIAPNYDRANAILSLGVHGRWRRQAVRRAELRQGQRVLDVATGTGDLAIELSHRVGASGRVVGGDFCRPMLEQALVKTDAPIDWAWSDAQKLPFRDSVFDAATIGFGIRNVDAPQVALKEMARVVRPGGRVVVLEFGQPTGAMSWPYRFYSRHVMPRLGGWLTGDRQAYEYLPRTAAAFPSGEDFVRLMESTGCFLRVDRYRQTFGIAYVYVGLVAP
jgi:demethylmenaquinone methyltransferase / 2-methoxy-6-polyprenyl-1,4-benzoquinol methylase